MFNYERIMDQIRGTTLEKWRENEHEQHSSNYGQGKVHCCIHINEKRETVIFYVIIRTTAQSEDKFNYEKQEVREEGFLTVNIGKNVAFNSLKMARGDSRRKIPKTVK